VIKKILILLLLITLLSCTQRDENKLAKKRLLNDKDSNPYVAVIKPLNIDSSKFEKDMLEFEKSFLMPYSYIANRVGAHRSETKTELTYSRVDKIKVADLDVTVPVKDDGASDKKLPPVVNNLLTLTQTTLIEHTKGENFHIKTDNNMGYGKDIKWINQILFIKSKGERYTHRSSINNEHLTYKEEGVTLLKEFIKMNHYMFSVSFKKDSTYEGRDVKIYTLNSAETSYKKSEVPKNDFKLLKVKGEIYIDSKNMVPLKINIDIVSEFKSSKFKNKLGKAQRVKKEIKYERKIYDIGKEIMVEPAKESFNTRINPSEEDAEEKILAFKKGHSVIEKLKKKNKKYRKMIGKSSK